MEFLTALDSFHKSNPDRLGPASAQLRRSLGRYVPEALFDRLVAALIADGTINSDGMLLHRPEHPEQFLQEVLARQAQQQIDEAAGSAAQASSAQPRAPAAPARTVSSCVGPSRHDRAIQASCYADPAWHVAHAGSPLP